MNNGSDLTLFWAIDGGVEIIKLLHGYGAALDTRTPKDWTPLSYCRAKGKYGATEEKGIYPEVLSCDSPPEKSEVASADGGKQQRSTLSGPLHSTALLTHVSSDKRTHHMITRALLRTTSALW